MSEAKWIKLYTSLYDNPKIKYIRSLPKGNEITLIWIMLLIRAGKCNRSGQIFLTEDIPYTAPILANELGFDLYIIELSIKTFMNLKMIQIEEGIIKICSWEEHQNVEGLERIREQNRQRVIKYREKQKQLMSNNLGNVTVTECNEIDKKREEDKKRKEKDEYKEIIEYLNLIVGTRYKNSSKKTVTLIKARIKEGFTIEDFKKVIDIKAKEWLGTDMEKYLRPETLFGTKFEGYLNEKGGGYNGINRNTVIRQDFRKNRQRYEEFKPETNRFLEEGEEWRKSKDYL